MIDPPKKFGSKLLKPEDIVSAQLELTTRCNLKCRVCNRQTSLVPKKKDIDLDLLKTITKPYGHLSLVSGIGEPTLYPHFVEAIDYFEDKIIDIQSNMTTRMPEWWYDLGKKFSRRRHSRVLFAIDIEEHWERYRQVANWHRLIENVKAYTSAGGNAWAHMIEFKHNKDARTETENLARTLGCTNFRVKASWGYDDVCESPTEYPVKDEDEIRCSYYLHRQVVIGYEGNIVPCCFMVFNERQQEKLKENDMLHYIKHKSCLIRDELKSLDTAVDSKLFKYIDEKPWNCTLKCFRPNVFIYESVFATGGEPSMSDLSGRPGFMPPKGVTYG